MTFDSEKYISQFTTKEQVKNELARLQRNIENVTLHNKYKSLLWDKKFALLELYWQKYCHTVYYMDDVGKTHIHYEEI